MSVVSKCGDGVQFNLFADNSEIGEEWLREQKLVRDLDRFSEWLAEHGASDGTIYDRRAHLRAAVTSSGVPSAAFLVQHPARAARAILQPGQRHSREGRLRALVSFARSCLSETAALEFIAGIEQELPRRLRPRDAFLNIDVGGSSKLVRRRVPFLYDDGDRLITAAAGIARSDCMPRDTALAAMHVRSTLRPLDILALDWDRVVTLVEGDVLEGIGRLEITVNGRAASAVAMPEARRALRALWDSRGRPRRGPLFISARQPRSRLSSEYGAQLLKEAASAAGFAGLGRRSMRAPLVYYLRQVEGWGRLELRDACGLKSVKEIERILRLVEELTAQFRTPEATFIPEPAAAEYHRTDEVPVDYRSLKQDARATGVGGNGW